MHKTLALYETATGTLQFYIPAAEEVSLKG